MDLDSCPNCGADLPPKVNVCPECGSDEKTGWSDEAALNAFDLPDQEFNYDEFVAREFDGQEKKRPTHWLWLTTAAVVIVLLLVFLLR
jgi:hypothetical protein